jgi:putative transposase
VKEKKAMIDPTNAVISIARQCELIQLSRASYYRMANNSPILESPENLELMRLIDEEYTRHPFYSSRQLRNYLCRQGFSVNRKRVQRLMRLMGIMSVAPKPNTSKKGKAHKIYPYLLRDLVIDQPNQVWCTDLTYIRMHGSFVYLVAIMDWYSRKVLSWEISNTMDDSFCVSALESAIRRYGVPGIFNTDQGSQFTGKAFIKVLQDNDIKISMDGKGCWVDNVFIERLWRSVKYEDVYLKEYPTVVALRRGLREYFRFYNDERPHESLGKCTPSELRWT